MFDSHAHVTFSQFDDDREAVIARAHGAGVVGWLEVGTDLASSQRAVAFAQQHDGVSATVGVHPSDSAGLTEADWATLKELLTQPTVVAVGEVGLDYYRGGTAREQLPVLTRFVDLAVERDVPVVLHVRDSKTTSAHKDMINFLQSLPSGKRPRGVMHTFSGNREQAEKYLALGTYLSFSGVVTFKNAGAIAEVTKTIPPDRLLIETDCPFLAPEPYRGQRNEPAYVKLVAAKIASLRQVAGEEIAAITYQNAQKLFRLRSIPFLIENYHVT